ncbi:MAG: AAA family ATPase [Nitrososphaera sp.]|nr:AAA family ATPase [Nitrososphaera sp.]
MINLSVEQQTAVDMCLDKSLRIVSVTGPAGTGKTSIMENVHAELLENDKRVLLAAPTGRAAKRVQEATGIEARTIHRLLEFPAPIEVIESGGKVKFGEPKRNRWNPLQCDFLLVDEASMIASKLYSQLMEAVPTHACVRFFGDVNQLPPIEEDSRLGKKSVFQNILGEKPCMYLTHNFRSDDNLTESANRILKGQIPIRGDKFEMIITDDPVGALREVCGKEYHTPSHQVLTPKRRHKCGSVHLSALLRTKFNLHQDKPRLELQRLFPDDDPITVLQDDKVLWTKNDYVLNIMNGELATIDAIDDGSINLILDDGKTKLIPPSIRGPFNMFYDPRKQIDLAYCMTTHKAQGSEFETVIYFMSKSQAWMLNRNNFYTGVTRAKRKVLVICDRFALSYAMRRSRD